MYKYFLFKILGMTTKCMGERWGYTLILNLMWYVILYVKSIFVYNFIHDH